MSIVEAQLTHLSGTTATCAVDDFESLALFAREHPSLWVHVDAAFAGSALICPEYQSDAALFGDFNSYNMNMHKWLLTNFDASCLWVKNRRDLTDALSITPSYLRNDHSDKGLVTDYRDWQIPLGRRFRSLKIWFVLRTYGLQGLRSYIRNHISYGNTFAQLVSSRKDLFHIFMPPRFALTVLQVRPPDEAEGPFQGDGLRRANEITKRVYETINAEGDIMLTSSVVHDFYVIRVVSCSPKTEEKHLRYAFEILQRVAESAQRL